MTKKKKLLGLLITLLLIAMAVGAVLLTMNFLWPEAQKGIMTATSSGKSIEPVSNILEVNTKKESYSRTALKLSDISDELPEIVYDGDISVKYSLDTMDDFRFDLYDAELNEVYSGSDRFVFPEKAGTYIARISFSWGSGDDNKISTENFFKIVFEKDISEYKD